MTTERGVGAVESACPSSNPFSTRFVRPGAIPYRFENGETIESLVERLAGCNWTASIVGPHGGGKSTLIQSLVPLLQATGRRMVQYQLRDGQRSLPQRLDVERLGEQPMQVIVDGYEQLGFWSRWKLQRDCRKSGAGLLVTSHQPVGLPVLFRTEVTAESLIAIVREQLGSDAELVRDAELAELLQRHCGNAREVLFDLYDRYEAQRGA